MRRIKQQLTKDECVDILTTQQRGILAVMGDDNYPYTIPLNYFYEDDKIYFHGAKEGHKVDALKKYDKASFCVLNNGQKYDDNWWYTFKSVIVFGKIRFIEDEDELIEKLTLLGNKYFPSSDYTVNEINKYISKTLMMELDINHMTGKIVEEK